MKLFTYFTCFVYALLWGGIIEVLRSFIFFSFIWPSDVPPVGIATEFFIQDLYAIDGFSAYATYLELMLLPLCIATITLIFYCGRSVSKHLFYKILFVFFCLETLMGMFIVLCALIPLAILPRPEILNPEQTQTPIAEGIHVIFLCAFACIIAIVTVKFCLLVKKKLNKKDRRVD